MLEKIYYKYGTTDSILKMLLSGTIRYSRPILFNDPYDVQFNLDMYIANEGNINNLKKIFEKKEKAVTRIEKNWFNWLTNKPNENQISFNQLIESYNYDLNQLKEFLSNTFVFSLTQSKDNLLMWAHYANYHKGVVVQFDFSKADPNILLNVKYSKSLPLPFLKKDPIQQNNNYLNTCLTNLISVKSDEWAYEQEVRLVGNAYEDEEYKIPLKKDYCNLPFEKEIVKSIYLGYRMTIEEKILFHKIKKLYPSIKIYETHLKENDYGLEFSPLDESHFF